MFTLSYHNRCIFFALSTYRYITEVVIGHLRSDFDNVLKINENYFIVTKIEIDTVNIRLYCDFWLCDKSK